MTPKEASDILRAKATALRRELHAAERDQLLTGLQIAISCSTGPYRARILSKLEHPYAKRRPRPPMPPGVINVQTADLALHWRRRTLKKVGESLVSGIYNTAPEAVYFDEDAYPQGTGSMIARPIQERIRHQWRPHRIHALEMAVRKVI